MTGAETLELLARWADVTRRPGRLAIHAVSFLTAARYREPNTTKCTVVAILPTEIAVCPSPLPA